MVSSSIRKICSTRIENEIISIKRKNVTLQKHAPNNNKDTTLYIIRNNNYAPVKPLLRKRKIIKEFSENLRGHTKNKEGGVADCRPRDIVISRVYSRSNSFRSFPRIIRHSNRVYPALSPHATWTGRFLEMYFAGNETIPSNVPCT